MRNFHRRKINKEGRINLPRGFFSGKYVAIDGCIAVFPETEISTFDLPKPLLEYAGLKKGDEAVVVNCGEYFEIWEEHRFEETIKNSSDYFKEKDLDVELR